MTLSTQAVWLFLMALPIAAISWTVTHEEVFREPREYCVRMSKQAPHLMQRKLFFLFTCEYCFSHYVTAIFVGLTGFHLLVDNWFGYLIAGFGLVWVSNFYMSIFGVLRVDLRKDRLETEHLKHKIEQKKSATAPEIERPAA
jgi:hypothetical protein